jgi:hypothetical protein
MAKPASGSTLNTGHALYTNLQNAWAFLEGSGTTSVDSRSANNLTLDGGGNVIWDTDASGDNVININSFVARPLALDSLINVPNSGDWTIAWGMDQDDADDLRGMILGTYLEGTRSYLFARNGTNLSYRYKEESITVSFGDAADDFKANINCVLAFSNSSGDAKLYIDGVLVDTKALVTTRSLDIDTIGHASTSVNTSFIGLMKYVYVWVGRELNATEAAALTTDPYDFFTPATPPDEVTIAYPRIINRNVGSTQDIPLSGTWSGDDADAVQAKIFLESDDSSIVDWTDVDVTLTGATWSGVITIPTGGPYYLQARTVNAADSVLATSTSGSSCLVGDVFLITGQSNALAQADNAQPYTGSQPAWLVSEDNALETTLPNVWSQQATDLGFWGPVLANYLSEANAVPMVFYISSSKGTAIDKWGDGQLRRVDINDQLAAHPPTAIKGILWYQGESEVSLGTALATYKAAEADWATYAGTLPGNPKLISCNLAELDYVNTGNLVRGAKLQNVAEGTTLHGPILWPYAVGGVDNTHMTADADQVNVAGRFYLCMEDHYFGGSNGRGPRLLSASASGSDVVLTFDRDLDASDTTYTAAVFEIDNDDGSSVTVSTATRTGTRQVTLVCSGDVDGTAPTITVNADSNPAAGATVPKTEVIALPLTIHSLAGVPLYMEPFLEFPIVFGSGSSNGLVSRVDSLVAQPVGSWVTE